MMESNTNKNDRKKNDTFKIMLLLFFLFSYKNLFLFSNVSNSFHFFIVFLSLSFFPSICVPYANNMPIILFGFVFFLVQS